MASNRSFTFAISLSVLNHLGRHLYRSFGTVLGEAISNAWDADATNVWIYLDPNKNGFVIKDDGDGMTAEDFQDKFLKIGYSKRKGGKRHSKKGRPFIGRKGIGKLALLSCAERISVLSKTKGGGYVGGAIDNSALDNAIDDDLTPQDYPLGQVSTPSFARYTRGHKHGTIVRFEHLKDGVRRSFAFLGKTIALYFRFSLLDPSFKIFLNGERISEKHLAELLGNTEFLWKIGARNDPYVRTLEGDFAKKPKDHEAKRIQLAGVTGFIASVGRPSHLRIMTTEERVGVDLFVNGRLREKDILKHLPTARIVENYLYGQIHLDGLDDKTDRFTSSREGIVADDPKYQKFLARFRTALLNIVEDWDEWRRKHRKEGDPENQAISQTTRASLGLYNVVAKGYEPVKGSKAGDKVDGWVNELSSDAAFNFESYAECFISENLIRKFIKAKPVPLSPEARAVAKDIRGRETANKGKGNISIQIRREKGDLSYLAMDDLANLVDKPGDRIKQASLSRDASEFKPMRDAVAHTALLTDEAKAKLITVRENIKGRVKTLLK